LLSDNVTQTASDYIEAQELERGEENFTRKIQAEDSLYDADGA